MYLLFQALSSALFSAFLCSVLLCSSLLSDLAVSSLLFCVMFFFPFCSIILYIFLDCHLFFPSLHFILSIFLEQFVLLYLCNSMPYFYSPLNCFILPLMYKSILTFLLHKFIYSSHKNQAVTCSTQQKSCLQFV